MHSHDVVVIGGGQAGLAISFLLSEAGVDHVILEREAIAARWRSRWDSFTLVTPNWMIRLPGAEYSGPDADEFMPRDEVVDYLEHYAASFSAPVRLATEATQVETNTNDGYVIQTNDGPITTRAVVVASGSFATPRRPRIGELRPEVADVHSSQYRNPDSLPPGGVLVVGSGQSGAQIAEELHEAGRRVVLSVSRAPRLPRRYRGRDVTRWIVEMGVFDIPAERLESPAQRFAASAHASGKRGGHTLNLHRFARDGITLVGRVNSIADGVVGFADDLATNLTRADEASAGIRRAIDGYIAERTIDAPPVDEENTDEYYGDDGFRQRAVHEIDLATERLGSVIWSAGYGFDFSWVEPVTLDDWGYPVQRRGVTDAPGLYFLGLHYLHTPTSGLMFGVGDDARNVVSYLLAHLDSSAA